MTAETDTPIDDRLRRATQGIVPCHADQTFRRLLAVAPLLRDWREAGYSHAQIHEMLSAQGLTCRPGTLRGYVARILAADDIYRARHGRAPSTPELRALCRRGGKARGHALITNMPTRPVTGGTTVPGLRRQPMTAFDETQL